jgi:hypothetical protein
MNISPDLLEAQSLNAHLLAKIEGLLNMMKRRGYDTSENSAWMELLENSIASHEHCEEVLKRVLAFSEKKI